MQLRSYVAKWNQQEIWLQNLIYHHYSYINVNFYLMSLYVLIFYCSILSYDMKE